jgi:L-ascorbate metabolism protein UlaG (beta-lactamase superfamily)
MTQHAEEKMPVSIKWFPPSWIQINVRNRLIYIDPAYLKTYFKNYPKRIEFSTWPDPIDGLPEELETADLILVTHHHKDHCKRVTLDRLRRPEMQEFGPVDVAMLPVGGTFTMDVDAAVEAARVLNARVVIPIHRFEADLQKLAGALADNPDITLIPLDIGETYRLPYPV